MREVEVAVAYVGGRWDSVWVEIPDNASVLSDEELAEKAEEEALGTVNTWKNPVSFVKVLHINPPEDDLSC